MFGSEFEGAINRVHVLLSIQHNRHTMAGGDDNDFDFDDAEDLNMAINNLP